MYASHLGSPPGEVSAHHSIWQSPTFCACVSSIGTGICSVAIWLLLPPSSLWRVMAVLPFVPVLIILAILLYVQPTNDQAKAAPGGQPAHQQKPLGSENLVTMQRGTSRPLKRSTCGRLPRSGAPGPIAAGPRGAYWQQQAGTQPLPGRPVLLSVKSRLAYRSDLGWYDPGGMFLVDQPGVFHPREPAFHLTVSSGRLRRALA